MFYYGKNNLSFQIQINKAGKIGCFVIGLLCEINFDKLIPRD